jgi:hypothetical protein
MSEMCPILIPLPGGYDYFCMQWVPKDTPVSHYVDTLEYDWRMFDAILSELIKMDQTNTPFGKMLCAAMNQRQSLIRMLQDQRRRRIPMLYRSEARP